MESVQNNFPNNSSMKLKQEMITIKSIAVDFPKVVVRRLSAKFPRGTKSDEINACLKKS